MIEVTYKEVEWDKNWRENFMANQLILSGSLNKVNVKATHKINLKRNK